MRIIPSIRICGQLQLKQLNNQKYKVLFLFRKNLKYNFIFREWISGENQVFGGSQNRKHGFRTKLWSQLLHFRQFGSFVQLCSTQLCGWLLKQFLLKYALSLDLPWCYFICKDVSSSSTVKQFYRTDYFVSFHLSWITYCFRN